MENNNNNNNNSHLNRGVLQSNPIMNKVIVGVVSSLLVIYMGVLSANQIELAKRGEWMRNLEIRVSALEEDVDYKTSDRYTRREAEKDYQNIVDRIKRIEKYCKTAEQD